MERFNGIPMKIFGLILIRTVKLKQLARNKVTLVGYLNVVVPVIGRFRRNIISMS